MRIVFLGDIVGRAGRDVLVSRLPEIRSRLAVDCVIANGENAAGGFGITAKIVDAFLDAGVDLVTSGNHVWDQRELVGEIDRVPRLLRPLNYPEGTPGKGLTTVTLADGRKVTVINVMGRLFMELLDDPFAAVEKALAAHRLKGTCDALVIDIHAEATSEKMALANMVDGRASLVVGTHTHVPTADHRVLPGGTAYQSDAGMCGDYDSVIGIIKEASIGRFTRKVNLERMTPALGEGTLCGVFLETDDATGLARRIEPLRLGPHLAETWPTGAGVTQAAE